jgi:hypothetical protein
VTLSTALSRMLGCLGLGRRRQAASEPYGPAVPPPSAELDPARLGARLARRDQRRTELDQKFDAFAGHAPVERNAEPAERWRDWWDAWPPAGADLDALTEDLRRVVLANPELVEQIRSEYNYPPTRLAKRDNPEDDR